MSVPLGSYKTEGQDKDRLRFEQGRKTALGIAGGVVDASLSNSRSEIEEVSRGLTEVAHRTPRRTARRASGNAKFAKEFGREEETATRRQFNIDRGKIVSEVQRYIDTPFEQRGTWKKIRGLTPDLVTDRNRELATAINLIDQQEQERMRASGQPITSTISEAPVNAQLVPPVPATAAETFATRGPAFDPNTTPQIDPSEMTHNVPIESGRRLLPESIEGKADFALPGTGMRFDPGKVAREFSYVGPETLFTAPFFGPSTFARGAARRTALGTFARNVPTTRDILGTGLAAVGADVIPVAAYTLRSLKDLAGPNLLKAVRTQADNLLKNQDIVTVYHGTNRTAAGEIKSVGLNPKSGLTTNRQIAQLFANNNYGPDAEVLEFRVPRHQLRNPSERETWYVVADRPLKPITGVRRLATEQGGTKYTPQEPGGPTPDELAFGPSQESLLPVQMQRMTWKYTDLTNEQLLERARRNPQNAEVFAEMRYRGLNLPDERTSAEAAQAGELGSEPFEDTIAFAKKVQDPSNAYKGVSDEALLDDLEYLRGQVENPNSITGPSGREVLMISPSDRLKLEAEYIDVVNEAQRRGLIGHGPGTFAGEPLEQGYPGEVSVDEVAFGPQQGESIIPEQPSHQFPKLADMSDKALEDAVANVRREIREAGDHALSFDQMRNLLDRELMLGDEIARRGGPDVRGAMSEMENAAPFSRDRLYGRSHPSGITGSQIHSGSGFDAPEDMLNRLNRRPRDIADWSDGDVSQGLSTATMSKWWLSEHPTATPDPGEAYKFWDEYEDMLRAEADKRMSQGDWNPSNYTPRGPKGLGPGTPQGPDLGIETTGIPGEVPEIEEAVPNLEQLRKDLRAVLRGEIKPSPMPRKRGQYVGPALRRTLLEAGMTREEINDLAKRVPPVEGSAKGGGAFNVPGRKTPTPATAPSPSTAPAFSDPVKRALAAVENAVVTGRMTRAEADQVADSLTGTGSSRMFSQPTGTQATLFEQPQLPTEPTRTPRGSGQALRLASAPPPRPPTGPPAPPSPGGGEQGRVPGFELFDDPAVQSILDRAHQEAASIPLTEPLLTASKPRKVAAAVVSALRGTPAGVIGQLAEQRFILREALQQHGTPEELTNKIADRFLQDEIIRRFGTKTQRPGYAKLFHGYSAPQEIVDWVKQIRRPPGTIGKEVEDIAGTFKNTQFGALDIAISGVQFPLALAQGGLQLGLGTLNRSAQMLGLPYMKLLLNDPEFIRRSVQHAQDSLHEGIGPSSIKLKTGTVLKYIPYAGKYIDAPVRAWIDWLTEINFGIGLTAIRNRMHEGNLIILKLAGENITDPKVRRLSADWANGMTGASRGAHVTGRRIAESATLTSFQMARSQLAVLGSIAKGLGPKASKAERLRAALTLANTAAYVYGLQYLINKQFGNGPIEWVPGTSDWATIKVKGYTVPIIPNKSLIRAMERSVEMLAKGDEQDIPRVWTQLVVSRAGPLLQVPASLAGFGYEPGTGQFEAGTLSQKGRLVGALPIPPLVESAAFESTDPTNLALSAGGFNAYKDTVGQALYDIPQYTGLDNETLREIRGRGGFMDRVRQSRLAAGGALPAGETLEIPSPQSILEQGLKEGKDKEFIAWAIILSKQKEAFKRMNPQWIMYVYENYDALKKERPEIFDLELEYLMNALDEVQRRKAVGQ